ncbi:MAG: 54S ribosomal protein, mitochondrial [Watsoniomyces obsoletus]|nr:MAG: 54S ribosomal protein, mitochondrial [Watsoniomyces obsoletus]
MAATVAQHFPSIDHLTRTPTFHTPTFFTPDMGFDENHNVFESSFRESNDRRNESNDDDDDDETMINGASIEAAAQTVSRPAVTTSSWSNAPTISIDPLFRSLQEQVETPLLSMSAQLMPASLVNHAAFAHGSFSSATAPSGRRFSMTTAAEMAKETGVAPSAIWPPNISRPVYLSSAQEPVSPPLSAVQVRSNDSWSRASMDASMDVSCRSPLPRLFVDTSDPTTWSRYGQITPPDDSAPNSAHGVGSFDDMVESGGEVHMDAAATSSVPPSVPPTSVAPVKGTKRRRGQGVEKEKEKEVGEEKASKRRRRGTNNTTTTSGENLATTTATAKAAAETNDVPAELPLTEEAMEEGEDSKRSKFLERNRVAASKCRQKKKEWTSQLEIRARALQLQKDQLSLVVASLKNEVLALKGELLQHDSCGCERIRQYLHREADHLASMPMPMSSPTTRVFNVAAKSSAEMVIPRPSPSSESTTVDGTLGEKTSVVSDSRRASVVAMEMEMEMEMDTMSPASHVLDLSNGASGPNDTPLAEPKEP